MPTPLQGSTVGHWRLSALQAIELLKHGKVTPSDLIDVVEARLKETDCHVNAIPITCFKQARAAAKALKIPANPGPGYLYGLPIVVKDTTPVKGVLWTNGSKIFEGRVTEENDPHVENLQRNGAIVIGKSNVPEFGAGANTYNDVFGETRNPWDVSKTPGGSSGGTAAALAAGQVWLGTGADLGGSLRIPASFCGVVGFRSSIGLVPQRFSGLDEPVKTVSGPMARNVPDLALMLDAMIGQHPRDPDSLPGPTRPFQDVVLEDSRPKPWRIAWSADLGGIAPTEPEVAEICETATAWFASQGADVTTACPDLSDADWIFQVLRADSFSKAFCGMREDPHLGPLLKPELHWQIEKGDRQQPDEVAAAQIALTALRERVEIFFSSYALLCTPTVMTAPFDTSTRWLKQVGSKQYTNYVEWLLLTFAFSLVDVPAISVPCGFTKAGLPVGLQIVGPHRSDAAVLRAAALYERHHSWHTELPLQPRNCLQHPR